MESPLDKQKRIDEEKELEWLSIIPGMEELHPNPATKKRLPLTKLEREEAKRRIKDEKRKRAKMDEEERLQMIELQDRLFDEAALSFDFNKHERDRRIQQEAAEKELQIRRQAEQRERWIQQQAAERQRLLKQEAVERERRIQQEVEDRKRKAQQETEFNAKKHQAQLLVKQFQRERDEIQIRHARELQGLRAQYNDKLLKLGFKFGQ